MMTQMRIDTLKAQFQLITIIRKFFQNEGFLDVLTPPIVQNPGMETHIHPFQIAKANNKNLLPLYLQTSPEFSMKELLSLGFENIFTLGYAFRDEQIGHNHRQQFVMLEWYRKHAHYTEIMKDCEKLFNFATSEMAHHNFFVDPKMKNIHFEKVTVAELFQDMIKINIHDFFETQDIKKLIERDFKDIPLPQKNETMLWEDYYFLLFLNKIEPHLAHYPYLMLYEFPAHLSALSTLKVDDQRVCERFEIYSKGIEICNCFNELVDFDQQKIRFEKQAKEKELLYNYSLPSPERFYQSLKKGIPPSSGIAFGVERFLRVLTDNESPFWDSHH